MQPEADTRVLGRRPEPDEPTATPGAHPTSHGRALGLIGSGLESASRSERADRSERAGRSERWVGRYELIHRLAHGGMATVYLGRAKGKAGFEKVVAVKVIHPHLAAEAEFVGMFLDEARIAARLHHPHVVEILDLGEADGGYYMVMEFIEGENLAALVRALGDRKRLPITVILQILADTLEGLAAAHDLTDAQGRPYHLVHRDVSPHNILINLDGWAKVGDFGIMKAAGKVSSTKTGELRGKLAYMSPEQARGGHIDHRTDLFAVGVIGWELLSGSRLFACTSEAETLEKVMACRVPARAPNPELAEHPDLRADLDSLLARALAKDPDDRFAGAAEMLVAIRRLQRTTSDQTTDVRDPRAHLGGLMARHFQTRVDYARAALRRTGELGAIRLDSGIEPASESDILSPGSNPTLAVERPPTGSNPAVGPEATPTGTSPGTNPSLVAIQPPSSRWVQWVVLPMLGAAIALLATVVLDLGDREPVASHSIDSEPTAETLGQPRSAASTNYQPTPRRTPAASDGIQWCFSTTPSGAAVSVAGVVEPKPTPTCVLVPVGDDPIAVELALAGHETLRLDLTPVSDQNFPERLAPIAMVEAEPPHPRSRLRPKPKPAAETVSTTKDKQFIPVPDSLLKDDGD